MKKWILLALLLCLPELAEARGRVAGWCEDGNTAVTVPGTVGSGTQTFQRSYSACTVTVYLTGTTTLATIYSDMAGTAQANPLTAASTGRWFFYSDVRVDVRFSGGGIATPFTLGDMAPQQMPTGLDCSAFAGADFGAIVQACINALPSGATSGGVADASGIPLLTGFTTIAAPITFGNRNVHLILPTASISGPGDLFSITTSSNTNITIEGQGVGATQISSSNAGGRAVVITGLSTVEIRDLSITASVTKTSGYAIDIQGSGTLHVADTLIDTHYGGIFLGGSSSNSTINNLQISNIVSDGIQIDTTGGITVINRLISSNTPVSTGAGIRWLNGNDLRVDNSDFIRWAYGLVVNPAAGKFTQYGTFSNTSFDTSTNDGILFTGSAGTGGWFTFVNCFSSAADGYGINYATAQNVEVRWLGGYILTNGAGGVLINATNTMFSIIGALVRNENQTGIIVGAGYNGFSIIGNRIGGVVGAGTQTNGIVINAGASDQYSIIGNDLRNNTSAALTDGGTGINKRIWGNVEATIPRELIYSALRLTNTSPRFEIYETDGAVDNKWWDVLAATEALSFRILNDADSVGTAWLTVDRTGTTVDAITAGGPLTSPRYLTTTNCADAAGDAACAAAPAGAFVIDAADTNTVVSTTAITANSQIFLQVDSSLGTRLGVTCNTQDPGTFDIRVTARTAATSFTVTADTGPTTNPLCVNFFISN